MIYFILIAGFVLIYVSLKLGGPEKSDNSFKNMFTDKEKDQDIDQLVIQIKELKSRVDELENAFLLFNPDFDSSVRKVDEITYPALEQHIASNTDDNSVKPDKKADDNNYINLQIYSLYDSGRSIEDIASILRIGKGEVSLRLGLRKQKK